MPVGPVMVGHDLQREVWKASPDTPQIRRHLLDLLEAIEAQPGAEYPISIYRDEIVVWQVGEFCEACALPEHERIAAFDPELTTGELFHRTRRTPVLAARDAIAKIRSGL